MSTKQRLIYLPLGGAGEVGMNAYVYGYGAPGKERLILADLGVTFANMENAPGVDLIFPDIAWLEENRDRLEAIFITHAHEDHIGAVAHLWERLQVPVFARRFTAHIARLKFEDRGLDPEIVETAEAWPASRQVGPFGVHFFPVSHSVPESSGLVIDSPAGRVVHTGDFKLDPSPVIGEPFDEDLWREIAKPGIQALVCDSTNVFSPKPGRSEATLREPISQLVAAAPGMVVATTFASNIARLKTLIEAGRDAGRSVCLLGRAMRRMVTAGVESGLLTDFPGTITPEDAANIPAENLMLLATGSQGERRAASAALSRGKYLGLELGEGDLFLFSSKVIPGNERGVLQVINNFSERGVDIVDDESGLYHVSGHANRPDLERVHKMMSPKMVIPMHGEHQMLREHARLAGENNIASIVAVNGTMLDLSGPAPEVASHIEAGRIYLDGTVQIGAMDGIVRDRIRMALNGVVVVSVLIDEDDEVLGEPWVELRGLPESGHSKAPLADILEEDVSQFLGRAKAKTLADDDALDEDISRIVRKSSESEIGRKPEVTVIVSRLIG